MRTILHVTECLGSGVLNYIRNLCEWQVADYSIVVAYSVRPETPDDFMEQFPRDVKFIRVKGFTREIEPSNDIKAFFHLKQIVKDVKPDIIHLHSTKAGILGRWAINCDKYQVLYSPHAYSFLMADCGDIKRKIYRFCERVSDRKNCLTIADIDGELEASKLVTKNSICIPNGINTNEIDTLVEKAKNYITRKNKATICISGKVVAQKNPQLFNKIAEMLPQYDFIWIGAGPLENELRSNNITVTGWVSRMEAIGKILSSDVFIFTSLWESLSIALMEVMYLAMPCVVSKCDGNKDVIVNGKNGFLCESATEYAEKIKMLINDKEMGKMLGENAKRDILNKYNTKIIEEKYREILGCQKG